MVAAVTLQLSIDSAAVEAQVLGYLFNRDPLFFEGAQDISVFRGELSMLHKVDSLLGGSENTLVSQFTSPNK